VITLSRVRCQAVVEAQVLNDKLRARLAVVEAAVARLTAQELDSGMQVRMRQLLAQQHHDVILQRRLWQVMELEHALQLRQQQLLAQQREWEAQYAYLRQQRQLLVQAFASESVAFASSGVGDPGTDGGTNDDDSGDGGGGGGRLVGSSCGLAVGEGSLELLPGATEGPAQCNHDLADSGHSLATCAAVPVANGQSGSLPCSSQCPPAMCPTMASPPVVISNEPVDKSMEAVERGPEAEHLQAPAPATLEPPPPAPALALTVFAPAAATASHSVGVDNGPVFEGSLFLRRLRTVLALPECKNGLCVARVGALYRTMFKVW
jgi:hypothetical protein